ncbi:hypothetical protein CO669_21295 [Bradyrhizobium sp. Y36]|nr:hypothetical protein CO669_21295 [Bradyrhizobium sp. Y36]
MICVGFYTCYALFLLAAAYFAENMRGVFLTLSALPGWLIAATMPAITIEPLVDHPIVVEVGVYLSSFAVVYLCGWMLEKIIFAVAPTLNRIDDWWFDRVRKDGR